ncbi:carbohydrate ABC transporter permease [Aureibacillus halotolerans]|uniref:Carbohydrate ABC transporter membrane protein 2 (CUT1 family) n=1 Tax=Aureibacillus halotolerans TaxID=1508390 RepID=A0A4R6U9X3_9BACI|nr:carbohydrate ABC transporter permease [Aureibacillus halotolerans]TDQ42622.1 carbohydrate ABC transporter membrane protein 2 (CUT1 family) [Aureibacillus halotolerans]
MKDSRQYKLFQLANVILLLLVVFITLFPFLSIVARSFSGEAEINAGEVFLWPVGFNLETYKVVFSDSHFWNSYKNTVLYTTVGTAINIFMTTIFAYAISKKRLVGRNFFIMLAVFTMFFSGGLIPNYLLITSLGFANSIWAIVLPTAISIFNLLVMKSFFESLPEELEESASIDGANTYITLLRIILPLSKPVLATMILFYAVENWNSWFPAFLYFDQQDLFPVSIYLRNLIKGASDTMAAGAAEASNMQQVSSNIKAVTMVLSVLPILLVYPYLQKYFVKGVMLGSVKQ